MTTITIDRNDLGNKVAYDGCHKLYVLANELQTKEVESYGYEIHPIEELPTLWAEACFLRFVHPWNLSYDILPQGRDCDKLVFTNFGTEDVIFEGDDA
jgi:hypothetical protein